MATAHDLPSSTKKVELDEVQSPQRFGSSQTAGYYDEDLSDRIRSQAMKARVVQNLSNRIFGKTQSAPNLESELIKEPSIDPKAFELGLRSISSTNSRRNEIRPLAEALSSHQHSLREDEMTPDTVIFTQDGFDFDEMESFKLQSDHSISSDSPRKRLWPSEDDKIQATDSDVEMGGTSHAIHPDRIFAPRPLGNRILGRAQTAPSLVFSTTEDF